MQVVFGAQLIFGVASPEVTVPRPTPADVTVKVTGFLLKVAVTVFEASRVTAQLVEVPVQAPLQPPNVETESGVAVIVTCVS